MSEVKIRWTQRAAGRDVGDEETVERTDFVNAIIEQGRVVVLEEIPTFEAEVEAVVAKSTVYKRPKRLEIPDEAYDALAAEDAPEAE